MCTFFKYHFFMVFEKKSLISISRNLSKLSFSINITLYEFSLILIILLHIFLFCQYIKN